MKIVACFSLSSTHAHILQPSTLWYRLPHSHLLTHPLHTHSPHIPSTHTLHHLPLHTSPFHTNSIPGETFVSVDADCLHVLLCFALVHGNVNSILDCLQILMGMLSPFSYLQRWCSLSGMLPPSLLTLHLSLLLSSSSPSSPSPSPSRPPPLPPHPPPLPPSQTTWLLSFPWLHCCGGYRTSIKTSYRNMVGTDLFIDVATSWDSFIVSLCVAAAECLKLSLVKCDGGQKDDSHRPECILSNDISNNSASEPSLPHITQHDHIWYNRKWPITLFPSPPHPLTLSSPHLLIPLSPHPLIPSPLLPLCRLLHQCRWEKDCQHGSA